MTARPEVRRRSTLIAGVAAVVLLVAAAVVAVVGASAVANSTAGEEVAADERPVVELPATDNAALAVVDADGRLTSVVVLTLLPSGVGGSIVTIPVDADASAGFGDQRLPLAGSIDPADPTSFFRGLEGALALSLQYGEIVSEERLAALVEPVAPIEILPIVHTVVEDEDETGPGDEVAVDDDGEGGDTVDVEPITLDARAVAATLGTDDDEVDDPHALDVEVWTALAANAPVAGSDDIPVDEFGRPVSSASLDEVVARLWRGQVQVRDLAVQSRTVTDDGEPVVVLDIRDTLLVFALASPARLSTPNAGSVVRIEAPFSQAQIEASGGRFASSSELLRVLIGELLFVAGNPVSIDATPGPDGAPAVTRIEVADERLVDDLEALVPNIFGPSEVVVGSTLVDGVDVVVKLGTGYIDLKVAQQVGTPSAAPSPEGADGDGGDTVDTDG